MCVVSRSGFEGEFFYNFESVLQWSRTVIHLTARVPFTRSIRSIVGLGSFTWRPLHRGEGGWDIPTYSTTYNKLQIQKGLPRISAWMVKLDERIWDMYPPRRKRRSMSQCGLSVRSQVARWKFVLYAPNFKFATSRRPPRVFARQERTISSRRG